MTYSIIDSFDNTNILDVMGDAFMKSVQNARKIIWFVAKNI